MTLLTPRGSRFKADKVAFFICLGASIALMVSGFIMEPPGQVDGSVLMCVGWLFAFATVAVGAQAVQDGRRTVIKHGETEININESHDGGAE